MAHVDLQRERRGARRGDGNAAFGLRLFAAIAAALVAIGVLANVLLTDELQSRQIADYARTQQADVRSFEATGREVRDPKIALREVTEVIDAIGQRPGTIEALLIDRDRGGPLVGAFG